MTCRPIGRELLLRVRDEPIVVLYCACCLWLATVSCSPLAAWKVDRCENASSFYSRRQMGGEREVVALIPYGSSTLDEDDADI